MYKFSWPDIEKVLLENGVRIQYDGDKAIGATSEYADNDLSFSLFNGTISAISLYNDRVKLDYSVTDTEVHLNLVYGKRSVTVINETESNN